MFKKDRFIFGLIGGLLLPGLAYLYEFVIKSNLIMLQQKSSVGVMSIGLNLLLVRLAYKNDLDKTGSGLMLMTFMLGITMFYFKLHA